MVVAAQQSSTTTTWKLSSARLRTVEEPHWPVKTQAPQAKSLNLRYSLGSFGFV
jgi:hypothetical protein